MKKIIIIGGGGNGAIIASTIEDCIKAGQKLELMGFLDDHKKEVNGYPVLGPILKETCKKFDDCYFIYGLITVNHAFERIQKLIKLEIPADRFITIIHPFAVVSNTAKIGKGILIRPFCAVGPNTSIDDHTLIFSSSCIGHDSSISEGCILGYCACVSSFVTVEKGVHIGLNSTVMERTTLGKYSIIGAGSCVLKDVEPFTKVVGNPARSIGKIEIKKH